FPSVVDSPPWCMTSRQTAETVTHLIDLQQTISDLQDQVATLKEQLINEARHKLFKQFGNMYIEGNSYTFKDDLGQIARVNFPRPSFVRSFWEHDAKFYRKKADAIIELPN